MYDISEKRNAIKEVQRFLYGISENHISVTGIYDENTKDAVVNFQNIKNLPPTGVVDKETFDILFSEYLLGEINVEVENKLPFTDESYGDHIRDINKKMRSLLDYYGVHNRLRSSPKYYEETQMAVEKMRQIYLLDDKNGIDKELYLRIDADVKSIPYKEK